MRNLYFISDTHFNHSEILSFIGKKGNLMRGHLFTNVTEMNECMFDNWQQTISPNDTVYHLGDVVVGECDKFCKTFRSLNGNKILIAGNRDNLYYIMKENLFSDIRLCKGWEQEYGILASHIPIEVSVLDSWKSKERLINIHGHLHTEESPSKWHRNVSVECIDYKPINVENLLTLGHFKC